MPPCDPIFVNSEKPSDARKCYQDEMKELSSEKGRPRSIDYERALGVYDAAADPELAKEARGSGLSHTPPILGTCNQFVLQNQTAWMNTIE